MAADSKIEWTHHTFNPWRGCTKVSPGCEHCYADQLSKRNPKVLGIWGPRGARVVAADAYWREPLKWNAAGERHRVFCASLADVFEGPETMPGDSMMPVRRARLRLFHLIRRTPSLDWLLLTKRPENVRDSIEQAALDCDRPDDTCEMLNDWLNGSAPANVWLGTSVEDQKRADERIAELVRCPAAVRFLSCEPLLGAVKIGQCIVCRGIDHGDRCIHCNDTGYTPGLHGIHWVIVGGESGGGARPMHPDWARSIRDQCQAAGVAFFFKQWGEWAPLEDHPDAGGPLDNVQFWDDDRGRHSWQAGIRTFAQHVVRVGKKAAGRLLDGREWSEFPTPTPRHSPTPSHTSTAVTS